MNTPIEAYEYTLNIVEILKSKGIEVFIKPSNSRNNKETIKKYSGPECILPEKWLHVTFKVKNPNDANLVFEEASNLFKLGIGFDTGGWFEGRDWELDWSFSFTKE